MRRKMHRILSAAMSFVILIFLINTDIYGSEKRYFDDFEHGETNFEDMNYIRYDSTPFLEELNTMSNLSKYKGNTEEILKIYDELLDELDDAFTMQSLASIYYYQDVQNKEKQEEFLQIENIVEVMYDKFQLTISSVLETSYNKELTNHMGKEIASLFRGYKGKSSKYMELSQRESELSQEYYELDANLDIIDIEQYNESIGEKFLELVECRKALSKELGISNYAEYASYAFYSRELSLDEIKNFCDTIKSEILPLYQAMEERYPKNYLSQIREIEVFEPEEIIELVGEHIGDISEELQAAWDYMSEHGLYDIEPSNLKADVGFTIGFPSERTGFFINSPNGSVTDVNTVIHEFGHFSNTFYTNMPVIYEYSSYDLYEVHSQGLECLYLNYYEQMFGDSADALKYDWFHDILYTVLYYSYIAELEMYVYNEPNVTLKGINKESKRLQEEYDIYFYGNSDSEDYYWTYSTHMIDLPMYSISYSISALTALDIWQIEQREGREAAVDAYMNLLSNYDRKSFSQVLGKTGFGDVFSKKYSRELSQTINEYFSLDLQYDVIYKNRQGLQALPLWIFPTAAGAFLLISAGIILLVYYMRTGKNTRWQ